MPLTFKRSERLSIGTEIELQLVDDERYDLTDRADRADRVVSAVGDRRRVKHELTKSMVELNSSVHRDLDELHAELRALTETTAPELRRLRRRPPSQQRLAQAGHQRQRTLQAVGQPLWLSLQAGLRVRPTHPPRRQRRGRGNVPVPCADALFSAADRTQRFVAAVSGRRHALCQLPFQRPEFLPPTTGAWNTSTASANSTPTTNG